MSISRLTIFLILILGVTTGIGHCQSIQWDEFKDTLPSDPDAQSKSIAEYIQSPQTSDRDKVKALIYLAGQASRFGLLQKAEEHIKKARDLLGEDSSELMRSILLRESVIAAMKQKYDRCIKLATECIGLSEKNKVEDPVLAGAFNERGIGFQYTGQYRKAIKDYQRALDMTKKFKNERYSLLILTNLGATYNQLKAFDQAEEKYKEALSMVSETKDLHSKVLLLVNLGNNSLDWKKCGDGEKYYLEAQEIYESEDKIYPNGSLYIGLGDVAVEKKELELARKYFQSAKEAYAKVNDQVGIRRTESRLTGIAKSVVATDDLPKSEVQRKLDKEIAKLELIVDQARTSDKSPDQGDLLASLASLYEERDKWPEAAKAYKQSLRASRSEWDEISKLSVESLEEKELAISKLHQSNRFLWISLFCLATVATGLIVFWRSKEAARQRLALANATAQQEKQKNSILLQQLAEKKKEAGLATMSAGVLHDFNNYLTAIVASAESGLNAGVNEKNFFLNNVVKCGMSASKLTQNIYEFVGKGFPSGTGSCDLVELFKASQLTWQNSLKDNVTLSVDFEKNRQVLLPMDESELDRVIINLIKNSNEAINNHGSIQLRAKKMEDRNCCQITVSDDGSGMSDEVASCALDPYFSTKGIGRGLGLATVKGIVERRGGKIQIENIGDRGTAILVELPTITQQQHHNIQNALAIRKSRSESKIPKDSRLVLVEDDEIVLQGLVPMIEGLGIKVEAFSDFQTARNYIQDPAKLFDALVTDFALGDGNNGRDLANLVRHHFPDCRILLISGYAEQEVFENNLFDGFLAKPFTRQELSTSIVELFIDEVSSSTSEVA